MKLEEYTKQYGRVWRDSDKPYILRAEMVKFDDESACIWAGPFKGNYAYADIRDWRLMYDKKRTLPTLEQALQRIRFYPYHFPSCCGFKNAATSEEQLEARLNTLTEIQRKHWEEGVARMTPEYKGPTQEFPVAIYMCGNDDCSYTKWFTNTEVANEELDLLLAIEPCNFYRDIQPNGFVFTN